MGHSGTARAGVAVLSVVVAAAVVVAVWPTDGGLRPAHSGAVSIEEQVAPSVASSSAYPVVRIQAPSGHRREELESSGKRPVAGVDKVSKGQEGVLRLLRRHSADAKFPMPDMNHLTASQWDSIAEHVRSASQEVEALRTRRTSLLMEICRERAKNNTLEAIVVPGDPGKLTVAEKRKIAQQEKPSVPGQLVIHRSSDGKRFVSRVNPGDFQDIDALTADIVGLSTMLLSAVTQIVEASRSPDIQSRSK